MPFGRRAEPTHQHPTRPLGQNTPPVLLPQAGPSVASSLAAAPDVRRGYILVSLCNVRSEGEAQTGWAAGIAYKNANLAADGD